MDSATLRMLIELAKARSDAAQARYAGLQRSVEQARAHLNVLRDYAKEYDDRARCRPGDSRDPSAEHNLQAFLTRLQHAVDSQLHEVAVRENAAAKASSDLALCLRKHKSLETLALRRIERERRIEAHRDQKTTDEFSQRSHERATNVGLNQSAINAGREP